MYSLKYAVNLFQKLIHFAGALKNGFLSNALKCFFVNKFYAVR